MVRVPGFRLCRSVKTVPGTEVAWDRRRAGSTASPDLPRGSRGLCGEAGKHWNLQKPKVPALHPEAERDAAGSDGCQHPLHTRIDGPAQGSVACRPHLTLHGALYKAKPLGGC
jgi:hypothetical protein